MSSYLEMINQGAFYYDILLDASGRPVGMRRVNEIVMDLLEIKTGSGDDVTTTYTYTPAFDEETGEMIFGYEYFGSGLSKAEDALGHTFTFTSASVEESETSVYLYYDIETHKERVWDESIKQYVTSYTKFMTTALGERTTGKDTVYFGEMSNFDYLKVDSCSANLKDLTASDINAMLKSNKGIIKGDVLRSIVMNVEAKGTAGLSNEALTQYNHLIFYLYIYYTPAISQKKQTLELFSLETFPFPI